MQTGNQKLTIVIRIIRLAGFIQFQEMCYARYTTGDGPNPTLFTCHTISTKNMADMGTSEVTAMGRMCESDLKDKFNYIIQNSNMTAM